MNAAWIVGAVVVFLAARYLWFRVRATEAKKLLAAGAALIDVRTAAEFAAGHIDGARNIPLDQVAARAKEIGPRERPVVVYCASGMRSAVAAGALRRAGFAKVVNLGPMSAYR